MNTVTMKFGGTSVGSESAISNLVGIVKEASATQRVVVVVSAMSGVTDTLIESVRMASKGDKWEYTNLSAKLRDKHEGVINHMIKAGKDREQVLVAINKLLAQHLDLCNAIQVLGDVTPRIMDAVVSLGERLSSPIVSAVLRQNGVNSQAVDASKLLITDDNFQSAHPIWEESQKNVDSYLMPLINSGVVPVITGFIGGTHDGVYTTLGRGGSDFSGAIFAALVNSDEVIIWTDVDGVMTTDPRIDPRAKVLPYLSYTEVGEMAFYGAKVLHPKTVQPIISRGIPIYVRNTFNPSHPGTRIGKEMQPSEGIVKAVTSIRNISMLTVSGSGMLGVPGIAGRAFIATARAGASILMISQASSEQSFCYTVTDNQADVVKEAVEGELAQEIAQNNVDGITVTKDIVIITVVGAGMRGTPGVAGRVFTVMGNNTINVLAIAQGSSECSISFIIPESDLKRAVLTLHELALTTVTG
jgi:aspartate kinase